jgi:hypothetical protein
MSVLVTPEIQAQYDRNAAEDRAAIAAVAGELTARREELAKQVAATSAELAKLGEKMADSREAEPPRPVPKSIEDNDISANAEHYQEPDEDAKPAPVPVVPQAVVPKPARDDEEVPSFQWDEDPAPAPQPTPRPTARPAAREPEDDLSDHDWME